MAYALIDYPNDKGVHAAKVMDESELGPDLSNVTAQPANVEDGIIFVDANGEEQEGTMPVRSADVEISDLSPVPIPAGSYDGTTSAHLTAAAEVDGQYIAQGHSILGVPGAYVGTDTLSAYFADTLTEIDDSAAMTVNDYVFYRKNALETVTFRSATSIGASCFRECMGLKSASLLSADSIPTQAFYGDTNLESVDAPVAVGTGNQGAFFNCSKLSRLNAPKLTAIGTNTFYQNRELQELVLDGAPSIANSAFYGSSIVRLVMRGESVATLANIGAFTNTPFASGGTGGTLYVPQDQISQYEQATNWSVILAYPNNQILPIEGSPYEVTS